MTKLRVLVIDDSAFNRRTIANILETHPGIEVVGKAANGEEGLKLASELDPDLITLDIEMPRMDGFTFLRILMHQMPTPVIVISSHSRKEEVFQALELGAIDFIAKPTHHIAPELVNVRDELVTKALALRNLKPAVIAGRSRVRPAGFDQKATSERGRRLADEQAQRPIRSLICIGSSTGGPPALETLFRGLSDLDNVAFLIAQHMPERFTRAFAERLNRMAHLEILEAEDRMPIVAGRAYIAPGGQHLEVEPPSVRGALLRLREHDAKEYYVPSVDRLFQSAAEVFGAAMMGIILTGMGSDGREGVRAVREHGGTVIAESEETAVVFGMPKEAINTGKVDAVLPLEEIAGRIIQFVGGNA